MYPWWLVNRRHLQSYHILYESGTAEQGISIDAKTMARKKNENNILHKTLVDRKKNLQLRHIKLDRMKHFVKASLKDKDYYKYFCRKKEVFVDLNSWMSLKIHFLQNHLDFNPYNLDDVTKE